MCHTNTTCGAELQIRCSTPQPVSAGKPQIHLLFNNTIAYIIHLNTPIQTNASPSSVAKCLTLGDGKALVRLSASMSSVGQ